MTNQVVFIYRIKPDVELDPMYLFYLLGVLNSRTMLYYYYKKTGDIEWKSFPYLTQTEIQKLPVYNVNLEDSTEQDLYSKIAKQVQDIITRGTPPSELEDDQIEALVRNLYKITPEMNARIDSELRKIFIFIPVNLLFHSLHVLYLLAANPFF